MDTYITDDIGDKLTKLQELNRQLKVSQIIESVFPNVYDEGRITLRWKGIGVRSTLPRVLENDIRSGRISYSRFRDRLSLQVTKGNGHSFDAKTEEAMHLLSNGIGPFDLVRCLEVIKSRNKRELV